MHYRGRTMACSSVSSPVLVQWLQLGEAWGTEARSRHWPTGKTLSRLLGSGAKAKKAERWVLWREWTLLEGGSTTCERFNNNQRQMGYLVMQVPLPMKAKGPSGLSTVQGP